MAQVSANIRKKLFALLEFHILLLLFQLVFRQLAIDTTFVRDIGIFLLCLFFFKINYKHKQDSIETLVKIYLWYGILMSLFHIINGVGFLDAIVVYRNHFFPFFLFFVTVFLMQDAGIRKRWVDFMYVVFLILLVDIYVEMAMDLVGISRGVLPWYQYQFAHFYRFTEDAAGARIVTNPEASPVLGLLGWNNTTSCGLVALFSFFIPFLLQSKENDKTLPRVMRLSQGNKIILFIMTIGAMAILTIKTPFAALAFVIFLYVIYNGKKSLKPVIAITSVLAIVAFLSFPIWGETYLELAEETKGEYGFSYIFDSNLIGTLLNAAFGDSPLALLFGTDISNNSVFTMLEVRLVVYTIQFGLFWLILYGLICLLSFKTYKRIRRVDQQSLDGLIATGAFLLIVSYLVDFLHYAHVMFYFHMDIFVVSLAILTAIKLYGFRYES